ncbi:transglutaminase N-terminal domain-containing protein [Phenylobacterium sp.]|uniref:transglutaminase family protein n=1 Tax=Phenylobacterium sp. TaxID=1871053 RepID=UPI0035B39A2D
MTRLTIRHETRYTYDRPVAFGPQRLLIRPRDSHALRVVEARLTVSPGGRTRWTYDALGNSVCWLFPDGRSDLLSIVSDLVIERFPAPLDAMQADDPHTAMPIVYDPSDRIVLAPFVTPATADPDGTLLRWLRDQTATPGELALDHLIRLNRTIHQGFAYAVRLDGPPQAPGLTVSLGQGTCRDFAWLMVEAVRRLGYAARFVTGYLHCPDAAGLRGAGATHAWCQAFLPDLGWMDFDPTNGLAESADLIAVAVARTPEEAAPVSGTLLEPAGAELSVHVSCFTDGPVPQTA